MSLSFTGKDTDANDIALLRLSGDIDLGNQDASTICLPTPNQQYDRASCFAAGWGDKRESSRLGSEAGWGSQTGWGVKPAG